MALWLLLGVAAAVQRDLGEAALGTGSAACAEPDALAGVPFADAAEHGLPPPPAELSACLFDHYRDGDVPVFNAGSAKVAMAACAPHFLGIEQPDPDAFKEFLQAVYHFSVCKEATYVGWKEVAYELRKESKDLQQSIALLSAAVPMWQVTGPHQVSESTIVGDSRARELRRDLATVKNLNASAHAAEYAKLLWKVKEGGVVGASGTAPGKWARVRAALLRPLRGDRNLFGQLVSQGYLAALEAWRPPCPDRKPALHLDNHQLTTLPESIGLELHEQSEAVPTLELRDNRLTTLPESIGQLQALAPDLDPTVATHKDGALEPAAPDLDELGSWDASSAMTLDQYLDELRKRGATHLG